MNKWTKTYTLILIGIVFSIVVIYGISFLTILRPLQDELDSIEQQVDMFEKRYDAIINHSNEENIDEELADVAIKVPIEKSPDNVLLSLQTLASNTNVVINSISSSGGGTDGENDNGEGSKLNKTSYTLDAVGGSLDAINLFLNSILESERLMVIDTMTLHQGDQTVEITLTVTTYYSGKKAG